MIHYVTNTAGLSPAQLQGFFVDWCYPLTPAKHLALLEGSAHVVLAVDSENDQVVGFITALSDHVLSAYIPLLEVLPAYQGQGIGSELVRRMLGELQALGMVDLMCDPGLQDFYARFGMEAGTGMMIRRRTGT
ncbi:MAG: GNAT family N-acetyltransferase [Mycobacterium leprae]